MINLKLLQKSKTVRYGVPMLLLVVGGSFGLREFTQLRYDSQKIKRRLDPSLEAKVNVQKQPVMLEEEYKRIKEKNLDEWRNIRGPRPWEDSRDYQEQQRNQQNKKKLRLRDARQSRLFTQNTRYSWTDQTRMDSVCG